MKNNSKEGRESANIARQRRPGSSISERQIYVFAFVCLTAGMVLGYLIRGLASPPPKVPAQPRASAPVSQGPNNSPPAMDQIGAPLEAALKADPRNKALLIRLGNLYSDHRAYLKAIEYYNQALALDPQNVSVRTDLGTAYWYGGFPKNAVAEYRKALSVEPSHFQALFNLGIVYEKGLRDYAHAISTWEKILKFHPKNPNRSRVEQMIESARQAEAASMPR